MKAKPILAIGLLTLVLALGVGEVVLSERVQALQQDMVQAPLFEVDPLWPKPLPNHWVLGNVIGVGIDSRDHVFIVHRRDALNPGNEGNVGPDQPDAECCEAAPNVLEFDPDGNSGESLRGAERRVHMACVQPRASGGPRGQYLDRREWPGRFPRPQVYAGNGRFLMQVGDPGQEADSNSMTHFSRVTKVSFDENGDEAFVGDGYGNKRVVVVDSDTGEFLRYWGAYGNRPDDADLGAFNPDARPAQQFRGPVHCAEPSNDGLVYVCDRTANRLQVFTLDGAFVEEVFVEPRTLGAGLNLGDRLLAR